jgi:hypothetical protein
LGKGGGPGQAGKFSLGTDVASARAVVPPLARGGALTGGLGPEGFARAASTAAFGAGAGFDGDAGGASAAGSPGKMTGFATKVLSSSSARVLGGAAAGAVAAGCATAAFAVAAP